MCIRDFVRKYIEHDLPFHLTDVDKLTIFGHGWSTFLNKNCIVILDKNDTSFGDLHLMPTAVVCFDYDADVLQQLTAAGPTVKYLRADVIRELTKAV